MGTQIPRFRKSAFRVTGRRRKIGTYFLDDQRVTAEFSPVEKKIKI